jgi:hypothetical protein
VRDITGSVQTPGFLNMKRAVGGFEGVGNFEMHSIESVDPWYVTLGTSLVEWHIIFIDN